MASAPAQNPLFKANETGRKRGRQDQQSGDSDHRRGDRNKTGALSVLGQPREPNTAKVSMAGRATIQFIRCRDFRARSSFKASLAIQRAAGESMARILSAAAMAALRSCGLRLPMARRA